MIPAGVPGAAAAAAGAGGLPIIIPEEGLVGFFEGEDNTGTGLAMEIPNQVSGGAPMIVDTANGFTEPSIWTSPYPMGKTVVFTTTEAMTFDAGSELTEYTIFQVQYNSKSNTAGHETIQGIGGGMYWRDGWSQFVFNGYSNNHGYNAWDGKDLISLRSGPSIRGVQRWSPTYDFGPVNNLSSGTAARTFRFLAETQTNKGFAAVAIYDHIVEPGSAEEIEIVSALYGKYFP